MHEIVQGDIYRHLHEHRVALVSLGGKRFFSIIARTEVACDLLHSDPLGFLPGLGFAAGEYVEFVFVAYHPVIVLGEKHCYRVL